MSEAELVKYLLSIIDDFEQGNLGDPDFDSEVEEMVYWIRELLDEWDTKNG